jgi:hypothetical protein
MSWFALCVSDSWGMVNSALSFAKTPSAFEINDIGALACTSDSRYGPPMFRLIRVIFASSLRLFRACRSLLLEDLVLRQQLAVLKRKRPRPHLALFDKFFWVLVPRFWSGWRQTLIAVSPETVVRWHRVGFGQYWRVISLSQMDSRQSRSL